MMFALGNEATFTSFPRRTGLKNLLKMPVLQNGGV